MADDTFCRSLYKPNSDVGGLWTHIAFTVHAAIFFLFGATIAPIIRFFLNNVPIRLFDQYGEGSETTDGQTNHVCRCLETIKNTYTSQAAVGMSYLIVGFIKFKETDPYHRFFVQMICLVQLSLGITTICLHGMVNKQVTMHFNDLGERRERRKDKMSGLQRLYKSRLCIVYYVYIILLLAYVILTRLRTKDNDFTECLKGIFGKGNVIDINISVMVGCSVGAFALLLLPKPRPPILFFIMILSNIGIFSYTQYFLVKLSRKFRPLRPDGGSEETDFTFGQALVLFMLAPLILDFLAAFVVDYKFLISRTETNTDARPVLISIMYFLSSFKLGFIIGWAERVHEKYINLRVRFMEYQERSRQQRETKKREKLKRQTTKQFLEKDNASRTSAAGLFPPSPMLSDGDSTSNRPNARPTASPVVPTADDDLQISSVSLPRGGG